MIDIVYGFFYLVPIIGRLIGHFGYRQKYRIPEVTQLNGDEVINGDAIIQVTWGRNYFFYLIPIYHQENKCVPFFPWSILEYRISA
ncbi:MAG: hypothetical protein Hals2KO_39450 [Halioglobus sp.]